MDEKGLGREECCAHVSSQSLIGQHVSLQTPFERDSLALRTLHDLLGNKRGSQQLKISHFHQKSIYRSTAKSVLFLVQMAGIRSSCSQRIRLEIPTSCRVLFSLFRLDPVAKEEKTKLKIEI